MAAARHHGHHRDPQRQPQLHGPGPLLLPAASSACAIEGIGTTTLTVHRPSPTSTSTSTTPRPRTRSRRCRCSPPRSSPSPRSPSAGCRSSSSRSSSRCSRRWASSYDRSEEYVAANGHTRLVDITTQPVRRCTRRIDKIHPMPFPGLNIDNLPFFARHRRRRRGPDAAPRLGLREPRDLPHRAQQARRPGQAARPAPGDDRGPDPLVAAPRSSARRRCARPWSSCWRCWPPRAPRCCARRLRHPPRLRGPRRAAQRARRQHRDLPRHLSARRARPSSTRRVEAVREGRATHASARRASPPRPARPGGGGAVMSAVIRGSGVVCWPASRCQSFSASIEAAEVGAGEEDAVARRALVRPSPSPRDRVTIVGSALRAGHASSMPRRYPAPRRLSGTRMPRRDSRRSLHGRDTARVTRPRTGFAYLDAGRRRGAVLAFAHRGGAYHPDIEGLENTLAAFQHAVDARLPLPRDRRARHQRRRAAGLPRPRPRPGHRPRRARSPTRRTPRCAERADRRPRAGADAGRAARRVPATPASTSTSSPTARCRPLAEFIDERDGLTTGCCVGSFSAPPAARVPPAHRPAGSPPRRARRGGGCTPVAAQRPARATGSPAAGGARSRSRTARGAADGRHRRARTPGARGRPARARVDRRRPRRDARAARPRRRRPDDRPHRRAQGRAASSAGQWRDDA